MIVSNLVIVVADRAAFRDVLNHFDATDEYVDICLDRRRGERRRAQEAPATDRRRRSDRRSFDVTEPLRTAGWVVIPARQRSTAGH